VLSISGVVQKVKDIKDEQVHRQERYYGRFQRSVSLPAPVIGEGVKATYKNGLLEIRIPKRPEEPKKRINVDFH
jgi:HSP20 family protein